MPLPPGLARAITDSTSPVETYPPAEVLRKLEVYLADPRSTDAVYEGLVNRACAQPLNVPLVEKVVALLKAYLLKYKPSQEVIHGLAEFASRVGELPRLSPAGRKGVAYVRSCLRELNAAGGRSFWGSSTSSAAGTGRAREDLPRLATTGLTHGGRVTAMKVSVSSSTMGRTNDRYAAADALPSPTDAGELASGTGQMPAWLHQSEGRNALGYQDLRLSQGTNPKAEPSWAVPSRPLLLPPAPPGVTAAHARSWQQHLPDLAARVTLAAASGPRRSGSGGGGSAVLPPPPTVSLSLSGAPPISLATIHRCVLDLEEPDIGRHIAELLGEARVEAQQLQPAAPRPRGRGRGFAHGGAGGFGRDGAGGGRRSRPPRLLFHHPPYNRSEQLPMGEADVAVVVEAVCGVRAASAMAAVMGPLAEREAAEAAAAAAAGQAEGMWQATFEEDEEFGQICGGILMKLLVDMWLQSEPQEFFIVVLRMLCRALRSTQPSTRARAFDVLYNLYIHGAMLRTEAEESALAAVSAESANCAGGRLQMPWQVCASVPVSPFTSGRVAGGGVVSGDTGGGVIGGAGGGSSSGAQTPPPVPRGGIPLTPAPSAAEPLTPAAASGDSGAKPLHIRVSSHSLALQGSTLLDSVGELSGTASAPVGSRTASNVFDDGPAKPPHHVRRDTGEVVRLPPPPPSPVMSPGRQTATAAAAGLDNAAAGVPTAVSGASGTTTGGAAIGYDRWLRALLFRLIYEVQQMSETSEEVWRAAMGCLAQMCSHGGYWVTAWVQHLPPSALSCLLRAACSFNWSLELYAQLLKLVPCVLTKPVDATVVPPPPPAAAAGVGMKKPLNSAFAAPAALKSAVAAAAADDAVMTATAQRAAEAAEVRRRLSEFGGIQELLFHFVRAPTPDSRASLMVALVQCCAEAPCPAGSGGGGDSGGSSTPVSCSGELHVRELHGGRSPRTSGSPGSRAPDSGSGGGSGPAGVLAVFQGLHLDSVCLALRAALERPWQGMSSRLADVLASANMELGGAAVNPLSPAASVSTSADYPLSGMHTLPAGVASPIALRALLRPLLENLEACCVDRMTLPPVGELRSHIDFSVAHIAGSTNFDSAALPPVTAASVAVSWRSFKDVCTAESSREVAIQWLHKLLSAACRACQGQILLLSPLTLKTSPEASKIAAATAPSSGPRTLWNTALADALLHVVREAPNGCELLMKAITRTAADLKAVAAPGAGGACAAVADAATGSISPRLAAVGAAAATPHGPAAAAAAAGAAVSGEEAALVACRRVMWLYYVGLQWMLQCSSAEARMPTVVGLADAVLAALLQSDPAAVALQAAAAAATATGGPLAGDKPASGGSASGASRAAAAATAGQPHPPPVQQQSQPSSGLLAQEPGGGMLISQQFLAGLLAMDPDALACTPPELLVTLLQQCSQSLHGSATATASTRGGGSGSGAAASKTEGQGERAADEAAGQQRPGGEAGFRSMYRGFLGRPCTVMDLAAATAVAAAGSGDGGCGGGSGTASLRASGGGGGGCGGWEGTLSGAAVGPWQDDWQDRRLALLLLLIARCSMDPEAFAKYSLSHVVKAQLGCDDLRCRYYAGVYLLKHWMLNQHDKFWRTLRHIIGTAQQLNDERLLDNPYLQMRTMLNVDHV